MKCTFFPSFSFNFTLIQLYIKYPFLLVLTTEINIKYIFNHVDNFSLIQIQQTGFVLWNMGISPPPQILMSIAWSSKSTRETCVSQSIKITKHLVTTVIAVFLSLFSFFDLFPQTLNDLQTHGDGEKKQELSSKAIQPKTSGAPAKSNQIKWQ